MQYLKCATDFTATCDDAELRQIYRYPESSWLRVNFVSSIDGAVTSGGLSGALSSETDKHLFGLLRELADVVVVGAGTVRAENYGGVAISDDARQRRLEAGQSAVPQIAVVTASANLDPHSRLFTDTAVPPLIFTSEQAPQGAIAALRAAGAEVNKIRVGPTGTLDSHEILRILRSSNRGKVLCEGGPSLLGALLAADLVDDLCLSVTPVLTAGSSGRIATGELPQQRRMRLAHTLSGDDGTVFTRWVRSQESPGQ
ncbi:pyrimidine reductase family protein [Hoyosella altamirensis]|uniref:5-amino-6-(5-phosphoribosylamino)uracil reductase n=1 Tax=Hoyosella altamirensis TaxID=616997 RepID=A0A839RVV5_9ACTN|nr:pyrimidine reductase family protein [Hoyosella altamirensis]MBB3039983.1 5-amino-6-(5-phosphoribosylamino)uracil reductase [Hoyosella altamirensis]